MTTNNDRHDKRQNNLKDDNHGSPEPLSGSKKVKNQNHSRQKKSHKHDM